MRAGAASLAAALLLTVSCGGDDGGPEPERPGVRGALGGSASTRTGGRRPPAGTPELLQTWRERVVGPRRAALRAVLEEARAGGEVRSDADLDRVVSMLIGSYYAAYLAGGRPPRSWPAEEVDIVLSGLRPHCKAPEHEVGTWTSSSPEVTGRSGSGC